MIQKIQCLLIHSLENNPMPRNLLVTKSTKRANPENQRVLPERIAALELNDLVATGCVTNDYELTNSIPSSNSYSMLSQTSMFLEKSGTYTIGGKVNRLHFMDH